MSIQRWNMRAVISTVDIERSESGMYVKYEDYAEEITTLKAQLDGLLEAILGMKSYINNPSAWDHFSQNVSDSILRLVALVDEEAALATMGNG